MADESSSPSFTLDKTDFKKLGKGAVIAALGALLTYAATFLPNADFGNMTPFITGALSIVVNLGWKYIKNNQK